MFGGPIQLDRGFVLHQPVGDWQSTMAVNDEIGLTTSLDILRAIASGESPKQLLVALGYSGWAPGQLDKEIASSSWLVTEIDPRLIFGVAADQMWETAIRRLGTDPSALQASSGVH